MLLEYRKDNQVNEMLRLRHLTIDAARQFDNRRGMAPLEFTLALPILVALLSMIFGICSFAQTRMMVTTQARNHTFEKRHEPWQHQAERLDLAEVDKVSAILGPNPIKMPADSGLVSGSAKGSPEGLFGPLKLLFTETSSQRFVLGGRWDHEEIEFEKHSALTLTDKAEYFGMATGDLESFKQIAKLGGGVTGGSAASLQAVSQSRIQQSQGAISQRLKKIETDLRTLDRVLNEQKRKLASLEKNNPLNNDAINHARKEVKDTFAKIKELKHEQALQQYARNAMHIELKVPDDSLAGLMDHDGQLEPKDLSELTDKAVSKHESGIKGMENHTQNSKQAQKFLKEQAAKSGRR